MKKTLLVIGLMLASCWLVAQPKPTLKPMDPLPFARLERNHIRYPGDSLVLEGFFQKMDSVVFLGKGKLNILHLGDSHIQAGVSTQQFRDDLLEIAPGLMGGQYFLFPYSAGKTNNPSHYKVSSTGEWSYCRNAVYREGDKRMGLAGAAITTTDPDATVSIVSRERRPTVHSPEFYFNKVTVIGYSETGSAEPAIRHKDTLISGEYDEAQSAYVFDLPFHTDSVCIGLKSLQGSYSMTGILLENGDNGISVHGIGVNGARVSSYLRCSDDFERDLRLIRPDLVILAIGTNDALQPDFEKALFKFNYGRLIDIIHRVNPDCALVFVTNNDCFLRKRVKKKTVYEVNANTPIARKAFLELAEEHHAAVWDLYDVMGGLKSMYAWQKAGMAQKDRLHFTNSGYQLVGDLMYNALIEQYIEHLKKNPIAY